MRYLFANWKMYVDQAPDAVVLAKQWQRAAVEAPRSLTIALFPDFVDLAAVRTAVAKTRIRLGAQDCAPLEQKALTGEISPPELRRLDCRYVLIGHSARRWQLGENEWVIAKKFNAARAARLLPVLCVGERSRTARVAAAAMIRKQLRPVLVSGTTSCIIAYEPSWAIGSDHAASSAHIVAMHAEIRAWLEKKLGGRGRKIPIIYGGSVTAATAKKIIELPEVAGLLVGRASTKPTQIVKLVRAFS